MAGIIGANDPDNGGVAPEVTIYNYKVITPNHFMNSDDFAGGVAIQQALEDNVDIANCSWGAGPVEGTLSRVARTVDAASALGMTIVKSAGNDGPDANTMTTPADALTAIVVGATDIDGTAVQPYSSRGPAGTRPGPDVVAPGGTAADPLMCCLVAGGFGDTGAGTSYAAPHITGLLALVLARSVPRGRWKAVRCAEWSGGRCRPAREANRESVAGCGGGAAGTACSPVRG